MIIYLPGESCLWLGHKLWFRLIPFPNGFGQYTVSLTHELIWHQAILLRQPTWTLRNPRFDRLPVVSLAQNMFVVHAQTILEVKEIFVHFHCLSWYRKDFVSKHPVSARSRQRGTDIQFYNNSYLRIICRNTVWKVFWQFNQVNKGIRACDSPTDRHLRTLLSNRSFDNLPGCPGCPPCPRQGIAVYKVRPCWYTFLFWFLFLLSVFSIWFKFN